MAKTLNAFVAKEQDPRSSSYLDTLPAAVQRQLIESDAGHAQAVRWLHSLGYERATQNMVSRWRRDPKRRRK